MLNDGTVNVPCVSVPLPLPQTKEQYFSHWLLILWVNVFRRVFCNPFLNWGTHASEAKSAKLFANMSLCFVLIIMIIIIIILIIY